jgi:hypothetical protein
VVTQYAKFERLIAENIVTRTELTAVIEAATASAGFPEELLMCKQVPKQEALRCIFEYYGLPFVEYDEGFLVSCVWHRGSLRNWPAPLG